MEARPVPAKPASDVVLDGYHSALAEAGVDAEDYELQEAAHIALSDPQAVAGRLEGQPTFAAARSDKSFDPRQIPTPRAPRRL